MMSSFPENNVAAAPGTEIQESLAQNPMQLADATPVYQPEDVLLTNPVKTSEVMNNQNICNDAKDVYAQPEDVVLPQATSEAAVPVAVEVFAAPEVVDADAGMVDEEVNLSVVVKDQNNGNNEAVNEVLPTSPTNPPPLVMNDANNGCDNNAVLDASVVVKDENSNGSNEVVVTPSVVVNQNSNGSNEVVTPRVVVDQKIYGSNEESILTPNVVGNQNNNGSNEVVIPSVVGDQNNNYGGNEVVTPSVVINYQNNGIGNNPVAINSGAINSGVGEAIKRKRGRPRKYPLCDVSAEPAAPSPSSGGQALGNAQVQGSFQKRGRGRPAGSGKKHKADGPSPFTVSPANSGSTAAVFLPYVITVKSGEYVQPTLLSLSQYDKQVVCVLSASGTISSVTLQQPRSSGGTVTYQGCFEILSLSGSFLQSEYGGRRSISGGLSVLLSVPHGRIFGGGVAGPLIALSDVQIIVGTFLASEQNVTRSVCNNVLAPPPNHVSSVGGSPPSRALLSESSGASGSPFNHSNGGCNNGNQQPVPNVTWT